MKSLLSALAAALVLSGCAAAGEPRQFQRTAENQQRLNGALAGLSPRGRTSCIPPFQAREQQIIDERTILFSSRRGGSPTYRSEIRSCPNLDRNSTIIRRSTLPQICQGEIFEVRDAGTQFSFGACTFGPITRYER